jgi:hypothetical protein
MIGEAHPFRARTKGRPIMRKTTLCTAATAIAFGSPLASAGIIGSLANFDVVNDTGKPAYGFEIEIDDPSFDHTKLTSVFGYDRNFGLPGGPGAVVRYGVPSITDLAGGGVLIRYGGVLGGVSTPSGPYNTSGESCWPLGGGWSTAASCDHFGVSTLGQPSSTKYSWLVETSPGVLGQQTASIPAVSFAYTPPPAPQQPPVLNAAIAAEAPNPENPENEGLWGEALWVKVFTTQVDHEIDLGNLFRGDADQEKAEIETEWRVLQKAPAGENGGDEMDDKDLPLDGKAKAVIRRYEFYKYQGPLTEEGEADCNSACEKNPLGLGYVGDFVGAQMAGFNVNELQGPIALVPEPRTYALMLAGLGAIGAVARRRRG